MIKYGLIGTGWISQEFVKGAQEVEGLKLEYVYSRSLEKGRDFARLFACENVVTSLDDLANSGIDAVYIASPNSLHYEQSLFFLERGIHVLCEKPATVNAAQIEHLQSLAKARGLVYLEAFMFLYSPNRFILADALKELGKIRSGHFDFSQHSSRYQAYLKGENPNIFNPQMAGGSLMDLGCYCICPTVYFWGLPKSLKASAVFLENGCDSNGAALLDYGDFLASLSYSKTGQSRGVSQIIGDKATLTIKSISQLTGLEIHYQSGGTSCLAGSSPKHLIMAHEARAFYDLISSKNFDDEGYKKAQKTSLQTARVSQAIREDAGIRFI